MPQIAGDSSVPAVIGTVVLALLYWAFELIKGKIKAAATATPPPTSEAEWFVREMRLAYAELNKDHQALTQAFAQTQTEMREAREEARTTKREAKADMAEVAAYTRRVLDHYESGGKPPSPTAPTRVAHYLNP